MNVEDIRKPKELLCEIRNVAEVYLAAARTVHINEYCLVFIIVNEFRFLFIAAEKADVCA